MYANGFDFVELAEFEVEHDQTITTKIFNLVTRNQVILIHKQLN